MRVARIAGMLVSLVCLLVLTAGVVSAAPINAPNSELLSLDCDNGASYAIVVNGNGAFSPGHIIDGEGRVLIPVAITFEVTDAGGNIIFTDAFAKNGQMRGLTDDLIGCTFSDNFEENGETFTVTGTVTLFVTPRH